MSEIIKSIEKAQLRTDRPDFNVGDTLRVFVKVVEGNRERLQAFEGTVIARRNGSCRETFTVRRVSYGIGVERTFPLHSPRVDHIEIIRRGKVRRARSARRPADRRAAECAHIHIYRPHRSARSRCPARPARGTAPYCS